MRICCGALRSTPLAALQVETGEMPLDLRRESCLIKHYIKTECQELPSKEIYQETWLNHYGKYKENCEPILNKIVPFKKHLNVELVFNNTLPFPIWHLPDAKVDINLHNKITKKDPIPLIFSTAMEYIDTDYGYLPIYTDRSKMEEKVTSAFYIPEFDVKRNYRLTDNLTIFTAELNAIIQALNWINDVLPNNCVILSDSLSVLQAIDNKSSGIRPAMLLDLLCMLRQIKALNVNVTFMWIPSHVGIKGNEIVAQLAKDAIKHQTIDLKIPFENKEVKPIITKYILDKWQCYWETQDKGAFYKKLIPNVSNKVKFKNNNRSKEVAITRLRFNHALLNNTLHMFRRHPNGLCDICQEKETVKHYLLDCIKYLDERQVILDECYDLNISPTIDNILLIEFLIDKLWYFITKTERKL
jgi:ribonuclease HI